MKWMIASDLHGSAYYTRLLLGEYEKEQCDRLLLLGDLLYHGPRNDLPEEYAPKEVASLLNARKGEIFALCGNCEAEVDGMMLSFPVMAQYVLIPFGSRLIFAAHGHQYADRALPPLKEGDLFLCGHTHVPAFEKTGGVYRLNPGSVSIPKEGSPHSMIVWNQGVFVWKDLWGNTFGSFAPDLEDAPSFFNP